MQTEDDGVKISFAEIESLFKFLDKAIPSLLIIEDLEAQRGSEVMDILRDSLELHELQPHLETCPRI